MGMAVYYFLANIVPKIQERLLILLKISTLNGERSNDKRQNKEARSAREGAQFKKSKNDQNISKVGRN